MTTALDKAKAIIEGQRLIDYGDPVVNFNHIAYLWNATINQKLSSPITAQDVALLLMQLKIARLAKSPNHEDSLVDAIGYLACYEKLKDGIK